MCEIFGLYYDYTDSEFSPECRTKQRTESFVILFPNFYIKVVCQQSQMIELLVMV